MRAREVFETRRFVVVSGYAEKVRNILSSLTTWMVADLVKFQSRVIVVAVMVR